MVARIICPELCMCSSYLSNNYNIVKKLSICWTAGNRKAPTHYT